MTDEDDADDLRMTWRERAATPYYVANSIWHSLRAVFTKPHLVEHGIGHSNTDGASVFLTTGPWWLNAASRALVLADTATGHEWCNHGPLGTRGFMACDMDLVERYGTEVRIPLTDDQARELCAALGWTYWPDVDLDDDEEPA